MLPSSSPSLPPRSRLHISTDFRGVCAGGFHVGYGEHAGQLLPGVPRAEHVAEAEQRRAEGLQRGLYQGQERCLLWAVPYFLIFFSRGEEGGLNISSESMTSENVFARAMRPTFFSELSVLVVRILLLNTAVYLQGVLCNYSSRTGAFYGILGRYAANSLLSNLR